MFRGINGSFFRFCMVKNNANISPAIPRRDIVWIDIQPISLAVTIAYTKRTSAPVIERAPV